MSCCRSRICSSTATSLVDDLIKQGRVQIPRRPGPAPACTDAEIITISLVRHMLGRRSEAGFLAEIGREWPTLFPRLPHPSEVNRRTRWLYGAFEQIRHTLLTLVVADDWGQIDTSALPVKHPSRVRGPDSWTGPHGLVARFGRDAAHSEWFYGFRLAIRTDLGSRRSIRCPRRCPTASCVTRTARKSIRSLPSRRCWGSARASAKGFAS